MNKNFYKFLIPLLFALALLLGLVQRNNLPDFSFGSNTTIKHFTAPSADSLESYYAKSQEISESANQPISKVSFLAVGDIMLSRNVLATMNKKQDSYLPYRQMSDILKSTDFNFGNLESPFYTKTCNGISGGHSLTFGAPCQSTEGFNEYNFKVLNLANNHALDQGIEGLLLTKSLLENSNIRTVGTGNNLKEAWTPAVVESNGLKICFVGASYSSINDGGQARNEYIARIDDVSNLKSEILNLKSKCNFVVATMHAGTEYTRKPNQVQKDFAHSAIDAGADMVIGAHPHWVQSIEKYNGTPPHPGCKKSSFDNAPIKNSSTTQSLDLGPGCGGKYIFYSLGNFIFDQEWSRETKEGLTLKITLSSPSSCHPVLDKGSMNNKALDSGTQMHSAGMTCADEIQGARTPAKLESVELIPVIIENYSTPRPATLEESKKILEKIGENELILK